jgi:hypothetical protein
MRYTNGEELHYIHEEGNFFYDYTDNDNPTG